jgi:hypothetical protein
MKKLPISFLIVLMLPALTFAAQLFGSLRLSNGTSVGANIEVFVHCPNRTDKNDQPNANSKTDRYGAYSLYVRGSAKCELRVKYGSTESRPYTVYSDRSDPVRYDFELLDENGALVLRRR